MDNLGKAIFEEDLNLVNQILEAGCELNVADAITGKTPLMQAVEQENVRFIELLLNYGASVNAVGYKGWGPLHLAVDISVDGTIQSEGKPGTEPVSIIKLLIDHGADLDQTTDDGFTPLKIAQNYQCKKIVEFLSNEKP
jgi:ankyrin repeat protein